MTRTSVSRSWPVRPLALGPLKRTTDSSTSDSDNSDISSDQVAAIVGAITALLFGILVLLFFWQKRRKAMRTGMLFAGSSKNDYLRSPSRVDDAVADKPRTPADKLLSIMCISRHSHGGGSDPLPKAPQAELESASEARHPVEAASNEVFEMSAGPLPVELDSGVDVTDALARSHYRPKRDSGTLASRSSLASTSRDSSVRDYYNKELDLGVSMSWRPSTDSGLGPYPLSSPPLRSNTTPTTAVPLSVYNNAYAPQSTAYPASRLSRTNSDASDPPTHPDSPALTHTTLHTDYRYREPQQASPPPLPTINLTHAPTHAPTQAAARSPFGLSHQFELPPILRSAGSGSLGGGYFENPHHNRQSIESLGSNFTELEERMHLEQQQQGTGPGVQARRTFSQQPATPNPSPLSLTLDFGDQRWGEAVLSPTTAAAREDRWGPEGTGIRRDDEDSFIHVPQSAAQRYNWQY